jgi:hypothetical protein
MTKPTVRAGVGTWEAKRAKTSQKSHFVKFVTKSDAKKAGRTPANTTSYTACAAA